MDPILTELARIARTRAFAALRVVLCAVLLLAVQGSVLQAQGASIPTRMDIDRQAETATLPAAQGMSLRLRLALPDGGGDGPGKTATLVAAVLWRAPETSLDADLPQASSRAEGVSPVLRPGRGPPAAA